MQIAKRAGAANPAGLEDGDAVDFNGFFKAAWDLTYLYLYVEVTDDVEESMPVGGGEAWTWDNFEIFIDLDTNSTTNTYAATSTIQLRVNRGEVMAESPGRAAKTDWLVEQVNDASMYAFELGVPWTAASATGVVPDMLAQQTEGIIGFDLAIADADGDGTQTTGGRNREGGAQLFWDQDTPIDNADNAYQNRRVFGWATLTGTPGGSAVKDPVLVDAYKVYPNPSNGVVTFANLKGVESIDIFNLVGAKVLTVDVKGNFVRVQNLKSGVYFARIKDNTLKFVVK